MSVYKFLPFTIKTHKYYNPIIQKKWFKAFNHWANPFGNWHEPLPYPEKRAAEAERSFLHPMIYWNLRNPLHNFTHFWIGITPLGKRYEWITPTQGGWIRTETHYVKGDKRRKLYDGWWGWQSRGNFRLGLGGKE